MKKYNFRLEKILRIREFYEDKAKIELGKCIAEAESIKQKLKNIAEQKVATRNNMSATNFEIASYLAGENFLKSLNVRQEQLLELLAEKELKVESARKKYNEATQKCRVLQKLKEKKITQWKKDGIKQETELLDELANFPKNMD